MQEKKRARRKRIWKDHEIKYIERYNKANRIQKALWLHNRNDMDVLAWIERQGNFQGAIKNLIRDEMGSR